MNRLVYLAWSLHVRMHVGTHACWQISAVDLANEHVACNVSPGTSGSVTLRVASQISQCANIAKSGDQHGHLQCHWEHVKIGALYRHSASLETHQDRAQMSQTLQISHRTASNSYFFVKFYI